MGVLADQRFPMASTSKVAIAATFLAGVDANRWSLPSEYRLPRPGGAYLPAYRHLSLMITKSFNDCTDALLAAVGGPSAVNKRMKDAGIEGFSLSRDIATLIREDGRIAQQVLGHPDPHGAPAIVHGRFMAVSYTNLTLPTIYSE